VQCKKVVTFYYQVVAENPILVPLEFFNRMFALRRVAHKIGQCFRSKQPVDFIFRQNFVEEYFSAFLFFFRLPAFQQAILVWPRQRHVAALAQILVPDCQTDAVAKACVGVIEKILVRDVFDERVEVENPMPHDFVEELGLNFLVGKQQFDEIAVNLPRPVLHRCNEQFALIVHKARIFFEQVCESGIERHRLLRSRANQPAVW